MLTSTTQSRTTTSPITRQKTVPAPSDQSREELLESYLPLVRQVADRVHRHLPRHHIDIDSLVQSGVVGLLEASHRYNADRGVAFADYARYRIRGEIIEYLRSLDWASRSVRAWGRRTQEGHADPTSIDPLTTLEQKDLVDKLAGAIDLLPEQEKQVLTLSYYEELTLREIGQVWGLTEGRICQIRSRAVERLREILAEAGAVQATEKKPKKSRAGRRRRSQSVVESFPLAKAA